MTFFVDIEIMQCFAKCIYERGEEKLLLSFVITGIIIIGLHDHHPEVLHFSPARALSIEVMLLTAITFRDQQLHSVWYYLEISVRSKYINCRKNIEVVGSRTINVNIFDENKIF